MLKSGASQLNINLTEGQISAFERYFALLIEWNKKFNLTRITERTEVITKHFLDSLTPSQFIPKNSTIADVGTGAGFPGLPLAIARPDIHVTLVDSLQKRITFLETVATELNLTNITCIHSRAEDLGKLPNFRESFNHTISRAVANLSILAEYHLPLIKLGGTMLAMKSQNVTKEIPPALSLISLLGGSNPTTHPYTIPTTDITHTLVTITKKRKTPQRFPRHNKYIGTPV